MQTIKQVEAGLLKYIDKELIPNIKQMGEVMLANLCQKKAAQFMGLVTADGMINVDTLHTLALNFVPEIGLTKTIMGVEIKITRADVETLYKMIKEA